MTLNVPDHGAAKVRLMLLLCGTDKENTMNQRPLTKDEESELAVLNAAVTAAIAARRHWLDAKMVECSNLKVGDDIYDLKNGQRLGRISRIYRYWQDRDEGVRDDSLRCDYEFETSPNCFDNTSRHGGALFFGTREDAAKRAEMMAQQLRTSVARAVAL